MKAVSGKNMLNEITHMMSSDEGDFVFGKPWSYSHAQVDGELVPMTEKLMATTIWWWRTHEPSFPDELTSKTWGSLGFVISSTNHEWRLLWQNALFFYEAHARWGNNGYLFDKPAILLTKHEKLLLFIAEMHFATEPPFLDWIGELIKADLKTDAGLEIIERKKKGRATGLRNTASSRKARPWRVLEIVDKREFLSHVPHDGERSSIAKIKKQYKQIWEVMYSSPFLRGAWINTPCTKNQISSPGLPQTNL
jgi:hypothetical protein